MRKGVRDILFKKEEYRFKQILIVIQDQIEELVAAYRDNNFNSIKKKYNDESNALSRLADVEIHKESTDYLIGRYIGAMEIIGEVLLKKKKEDKIRGFITDIKIEDVPHFNDIIINIADEPRINHQKLADKVGITKGALTPIMDKLADSGLVEYMRPGKFKYYYLTPQGYEYYKDKLINIQRAKNKEALLEDLLLFVENSDNPAEIVGEINEVLYKKEFKSNKFKKKNIKQSDDDPFDVLARMVEEEPVYISVGKTIKNYEADEIMAVRMIKGNNQKRHIAFSNKKEHDASSNEVVTMFDLNFLKSGS